MSDPIDKVYDRIKADENLPMRQDLYRHAKSGHFYLILTTVVMEKGHDLYVVYYPAPGHPDAQKYLLPWCRPLKEWREEVIIDDKVFDRFELVCRAEHLPDPSKVSTPASDDPAKDILISCIHRAAINNGFCPNGCGRLNKNKCPKCQFHLVEQ